VNGPFQALYLEALNQTLIPRLVEEFEVRPALALAGRHQEAVAADEIVFLADHDVVVTFTPLQRMAFLLVVGAGHDALPDLICH
jgi:hypothetical protein